MLPCRPARSFGCWKIATGPSGIIWNRRCGIFIVQRIFRRKHDYLLLPATQSKAFLQNPIWQNAPPILIMQAVDNEKRAFDLFGRSSPLARTGD